MRPVSKQYQSLKGPLSGKNSENIDTEQLAEYKIFIDKVFGREESAGY
jgi:hypothetical protein